MPKSFSHHTTNQSELIPISHQGFCYSLDSCQSIDCITSSSLSYSKSNTLLSLSLSLYIYIYIQVSCSLLLRSHCGNRKSRHWSCIQDKHPKWFLHPTYCRISCLCRFPYWARPAIFRTHNKLKISSIPYPFHTPLSHPYNI